MNENHCIQVNKKENQLVIAFCGPSTCGKSTIIKELLNDYQSKSQHISTVKLDNFFYSTDDLPKTELRGKLIPNKDLKQSVDWESFFQNVSDVNTPILFLDGFITFADKRSFNIIDICVSFEYNFNTDFDIALRRRVHRKKGFENAEIPKDYLQNAFDNKVNYRCSYFHDIVWPEMIKHPEYRKPINWNKPILTLSATNDLQNNVKSALSFLHPFIDSHINKKHV